MENPQPLAGISVDLVGINQVRVRWTSPSVSPDDITNYKFKLYVIENTLGWPLSEDQVVHSVNLGSLVPDGSQIIQFDGANWTSNILNPSFDPLDPTWTFDMAGLPYAGVYNDGYWFYVVLENGLGEESLPKVDQAAKIYSADPANPRAPVTPASFAAAATSRSHEVTVQMAKTYDPNYDHYLFQVRYCPQQQMDDFLATGGQLKNFRWESSSIISFDPETLATLPGHPEISTATCRRNDRGELIANADTMAFALQVSDRADISDTTYLTSEVLPSLLVPNITLYRGLDPVTEIQVSPESNVNLLKIKWHKVGDATASKYYIRAIDQSVVDELRQEGLTDQEIVDRINAWGVQVSWQVSVLAAQTQSVDSDVNTEPIDPPQHSDWEPDRIPAGRYAVWIVYENDILPDPEQTKVTNISQVAENVQIAEGARIPLPPSIVRASREGDKGIWVFWDPSGINTDGTRLSSAEFATYGLVYGYRTKNRDWESYTWVGNIHLTDESDYFIDFNDPANEPMSDKGNNLVFAVFTRNVLGWPTDDQLTREEDDIWQPVLDGNVFWRAAYLKTAEPTIGPNPAHRGEVVTFYHLPEKAEVWIYNAEGLLIAGPLRDVNSSGSGEGGRCQWTVPSSVEINKDCYCVIEGEKQTWRLPLRIYGGTR